MVTINSSSPPQNIIVIPGRVKSKYSKFLWVPSIVDRCHNPAQHNMTAATWHINFPILFELLSLEIGQTPAHTHVNTTEKVLLSYFLQIYS